ncbi:predicted protein [Nematostella vectensis]|uniref:UspA domain-containing protein n=1 Tax=Nematostella vectensis TaxID=45351 RepID=A7S1B3_NEMVE|nr:predicted protein [Nematostella vectensis]|eukprot:XP_001634541.1 predicted protein [Nematostella vectensis]
MATSPKERNVVLIPVDGSKNSIRAFDWYKDHYHQENDKVLIVSAYEIPPMQAAKHASVDFKNQLLEWQILRQKAEDKARSILKVFEQRCLPFKELISYRLLPGGGKAGEVIIGIAKQENVDEIIIGSRGLGKFRRTILGSVSDYVVHHASVPVIVVPPG